MIGYVLEQEPRERLPPARPTGTRDGGDAGGGRRRTTPPSRRRRSRSARSRRSRRSGGETRATAGRSSRTPAAAGGGSWPRRQPLRIVEEDAIRIARRRRLRSSICTGGGGIPGDDGRRRERSRGVEAVIDKDLAAELLATAPRRRLPADARPTSSTSSRDWGTPRERADRPDDAREAKRPRRGRRSSPNGSHGRRRSRPRAGFVEATAATAAIGSARGRRPDRSPARPARPWCPMRIGRASLSGSTRARLAVARGDEPADLVIRGGRVFSTFTREWLDGDVAIVDGVVAGIGDYEGVETLDADGSYVVPGFVDAHVHLESSKLLVDEFARLVLPLGTTAVVADPHEIANVLGTDGVHWLVDACEQIPLDVYFMASSCVPASRVRVAVARAHDRRPRGAAPPQPRARARRDDELPRRHLGRALRAREARARPSRRRSRAGRARERS